jgi:hypothetical protein
MAEEEKKDEKKDDDENVNVFTLFFDWIKSRRHKEEKEVS